ncbi:MAG: ribbon-helix-helix protein, CopG family [Deltaproteobacteria bacterium]|nr:ribbon-helix-helix protein, CopG family [Deltaproteobacteria bacterium]
MAKVMVSFPDEFLRQVDSISREEHRSRSEILREAMRLYMEMKRGRQSPGNDYRVLSAVKVQDNLSRMAPGTNEDSTVEIRRWRDVR